MDTIIDELVKTPLLLRRIAVAGPLMTEGKKAWPMWVLQAAAPSFGKHNAVDARGRPDGTTADHVHPLRVLTADEPVDGKRSMRPRLFDLHIVVGADNPRYRQRAKDGDTEHPDKDCLFLGWTTKRVQLFADYGKNLRAVTEGTDESEGQAPFVHIVTEALIDGLPSASGVALAGIFDEAAEEGDDVIAVPPMRLVAGRIGMRINPEAKNARWLARLGIIQTAGDIKDWHNWPTIWLVPDGIEFEATLPFPGRPNGSKRLEGRVLLHGVQEQGKQVFRLKLVEASDHAAWALAWKAIVPAAGDPTEALMGLKFSGRHGGALPGFSWAVPMKSGQPDALKENEIDVEGADLALSLLSPPVLGVIDSVATLNPSRYKVTQDMDHELRPFVRFTASDGTETVHSFDLNCLCSPKSFLLENKVDSLDLDVELPTLAGQLREAYGIETPAPVPALGKPATNLGKQFGRPLLPAFIPIDGGWLQVPVPNLGPVDTSSDQTLAVPPQQNRRNVLGGFVRVRYTAAAGPVQSGLRPSTGMPEQAASPWSVMIERAEGMAAEVRLTPGQPGQEAMLLSAKITLFDPVLSTRGLLWLSTDRPDAQEALPRLGAGPGAYIDAVLYSPESGGGDRSALIATLAGLRIQVTGTGKAAAATMGWDSMSLSFNVANPRWADEVLKPNEARAALRAAAACIVGKFTVPDTGALSAQAPIPAVVWLRHPRIPTAAAMPMTRSAAASPRPLESRDLAPYALQSKLARKDNDPLPLALLRRGEHAPFLAPSVDGQSFDLATLPAWPSPVTPAAKPSGAAERGIGFAWVGVPGAEMRMVTGTGITPGYGSLAWEAALRYDLPLLDEAFATASLPPTADTASEEAPLASIATTLDWPLLAEHWRTQERKQQNCRVVDSYLSGFWPVDHVKGVKVNTLLKGLDWSTDIKLDTQGGAAGIPYGALTLGTMSAVYGNQALLGYSGRFVAKLADRTLTAAPANGGNVEVLGFSPGTIRIDGFELDNALSGAAAPSLPAAGVPTIARPVRIAGATTAANLVSLAAPQVANINGRKFDFWFKDVLFIGANAKLDDSGRNAIDFEALTDDDKLARGGCEWRFAERLDAPPAIAFILGRSEIPLFGLRLEPLRLLSMTLDAGHILEAKLLCRLTLSPRSDGANLATLTLLRQDASTELGCTFALFDATKPLRFTLVAQEKGQVDKPPRRIQLDADFKPATAGTALDLVGIGMAVEVAGVPVNLGPATIDLGAGGELRAVAKPAPAAGRVSRLIITEAEVTAGYEFKPDGSQTTLADRLPLLTWTRSLQLYPEGDEADLPALSWSIGTQDQFTLLGLGSSSSALVLEEANGALSGRARGLFVAGALSADFTAGFAVRMGAAGNHDGTIALAAGRCEGVVKQRDGLYQWSTAVGATKGLGIRGARFEFSVASDENDRWIGTATIDGVIEARSDIAWPSLRATADAALVPLPLSGKRPSSGRVLVRRGTGKDASHDVSWTLSGHKLPLTLAAALARPKSAAIWVVPAMARHTLVRGAQELTWTGVESIAIGRAAALIPAPIPASDLATKDRYTAAARYRDRIVKGVFKGREPGMLRAGLGAIATVLQGALGAPFRTAYWSAPPPDRIMVAGGFLGLLKLGPDEKAAPLLRLPVLAGLGVRIAQDDLGDSGIELSWNDGPAARAVGLTRPTAPSPANASYDALSAALLAGSLTRGANSTDAATLTGSLLVEQAFIHRTDAAAVSLAHTPFFLASAIAVDRVLDLAPQSAVRASSLSLVAGHLARPSSAGVSLAAAVAMNDAPPRLEVRTDQAVLYVLGKNLMPTPWTGTVPSTGNSSVLMSYIRALAPAIDPDPVAFLLAYRGRDGSAHYVNGTIASLALDAALAPAASGAFTDGRRGLLLAPDSATAAWLSPPLEGASAAIRDAPHGSGLAGLARSVGLPASAGASTALDPTQAAPRLVWLSQTQVPLYLPLQISGLRGTPISWLQTAPPLVRLPIDSDIVNTLLDSAPRGGDAADAVSVAQPFMPGWMSAASVGERAGIMTLRRIRMLTRLDREATADIHAFDAVHPRFGAPGQAGSSFARKLRTPRPGPLPVNRGDRTRDRRVQASMVRPLTMASAVFGSSDIVQGGPGRFLRESPAFKSWSIQVVASPETASVVSERWDGSLRLVCRVEVAVYAIADQGGMAKPAQFIALALGLAPGQSKARLKINEQVIPYRRLVWGRNANAISWTGSVGSDGPILSATVSLTLDPREQFALQQEPAVLDAIGRALAASVALPAVEVQWMVKPSSLRAIETNTTGTTALEAGIPAAGGLVVGDAERAPLTLRMSLYPMAQARGALPLTPATLVFSDPAYDRDLAGPPASASDTLVVREGADQRGGLRMILSADRGRVNLRGVVTLMLDIAYERRLDALGQATAELGGAGPGGDLATEDTGGVARLEIGLLPVTGKPRELLFAPNVAVSGAPAAGELRIALGKIYEMPLAMLVEADGTPARVAPGDVLTLAAALRGKDNSASFTAKLWSISKGGMDNVTVALDPVPKCILTLTLTAEAVVEPPPALYLALQRSKPAAAPGDYRITVPLHAQSPLPRRIDLMDPARGFRSGLMQRHADFVWAMASPISMLGPHSLAVLKVDRNGQGYWPDEIDRFLTPENMNEMVEPGPVENEG